MAGQSEGRTPSPYARAALVVAAVVVVGFVAGVILSRPDQRSEENQGPEAAASALRRSTESDDGASSGGVTKAPAESTADEPGAVAAAVAFASASQQWLYLSDEQLRTAVSEIAMPAAAPRLSEQVVEDMSMAREQLAAADGPVWWLVRPLAWRVDGFHTSGARVSVWTIAILSAGGIAPPQTEYATVTLDLVWADGNWRVDAVRDLPGPTPVAGPKDQPWDAEAFDESLDGFTRMDGEVAP